MLLDGERWEPISSQYQIIVSKQHCFNTDTILLAHFASPRKKISVPILVQVVVPFPYLEQQVYAKTYLCSKLQDNACSMVQRTLQKIT